MDEKKVHEKIDWWVLRMPKKAENRNKTGKTVPFYLEEASERFLQWVEKRGNSCKELWRDRNEAKKTEAAWNKNDDLEKVARKVRVA